MFWMIIFSIIPYFVSCHGNERDVLHNVMFTVLFV